MQLGWHQELLLLFFLYRNKVLPPIWVGTFLPAGGQRSKKWSHFLSRSAVFSLLPKYADFPPQEGSQPFERSASVLPRPSSRPSSRPSPIAVASSVALSRRKDRFQLVNRGPNLEAPRGAESSMPPGERIERGENPAFFLHGNSCLGQITGSERAETRVHRRRVMLPARC